MPRYVKHIRTQKRGTTQFVFVKFHAYYVCEKIHQTHRTSTKHLSKALTSPPSQTTQQKPSPAPLTSYLRSYPYALTPTARSLKREFDLLLLVKAFYITLYYNIQFHSCQVVFEKFAMIKRRKTSRKELSASPCPRY